MRERRLWWLISMLVAAPVAVFVAGTVSVVESSGVSPSALDSPVVVGTGWRSIRLPALLAAETGQRGWKTAYHKGHVPETFKSQGSIHSGWNLCLQGSTRMSCPLTKSSVHTEHANPLSTFGSPVSTVPCVGCTEPVAASVLTTSDPSLTAPSGFTTAALSLECAEPVAMAS